MALSATLKLAKCGTDRKSTTAPRPTPGARSSQKRPAAQALIGYVLSEPGQRAIARTGWQPVLPGVPGPPRPAGARKLYPPWTSLFGRQTQVLQQYQAIFGA